MDDTINLTSGSKILPDGRKFPDTPKPMIIQENFLSIRVINLKEKSTESKKNR